MDTDFPSTQIVVEKLTKNVNEGHLREIFSTYGEIREIDIPMNRQFMTNRGTAYITYVDTFCAEKAISYMHDGQLDGATINVSIVIPRLSPGPPSARPRYPPPIANDSRNGPPPPYRPIAPPDSPPRGGRYRDRSPVPPRRPRYGGRSDRGSNFDTYRPRSRSRSPYSPRSQEVEEEGAQATAVTAAIVTETGVGVGVGVEEAGTVVAEDDETKCREKSYSIPKHVLLIGLF
ncbi:MAG: hypothetical protein M1834_001179 [Cirrosporium novae-zelandiae]|nr:MAG: hypothetical protein M1834_001179 [Cirrosporium novae-zelandiae]